MQFQCLTSDPQAKYIYAVGSANSRSVSRFDLLRNEWNHELLPLLRKSRAQCSMCCLNDYLYVIGGGIKNSFEKLDLTTYPREGVQKNDD